MTFFSDEELGEEDTEAEEVPAAVQVHAAPEEDDEDLELESLGEDVERRLEVAALFKILLQGTLFDDSSVAAKIVEKRVKAFVKAELMALVGMGQPMVMAGAAPATSDFTPQEVSVLKAVAAGVLKKSNGPALTVPPPPPGAPQLRSRSVPQVPGTPARPASPARPQAAPAPRKPASQTPAKATPAPPTKKGKVVSEYTTEEGERVRDVRRAGRLIKQYFNADGKLLKEKDVTPQARPQNGFPPPSIQMLEAMSHQQAVASVSSRMEAMASSGETSVLALPGALQGE